MKIGGPIEAWCAGGVHVALCSFPPMKIGGPIEALARFLTPRTERGTFPPMKIGGPIEAVGRKHTMQSTLGISADENRRPH